MTIGGSIGLVILGAILAFAVTAEVSGIDVNAIGFILMVGGVIGLIFGLTLQQRRTQGETVVEDDPEAF